MPKKKVGYAYEIFPTNVNFQSIGVGIVLLSNDLKIIHKNPYSGKYLKLPRKGANLAKAVLDKGSRKATLSLPQKRGSFCLVRFKDPHPSSQALMVRLLDGKIALILHTSMSISELLGARYSEEALCIIAGCVTNIYEDRGFDHDITSGKIPFYLNSDYLSERHAVMRLLSLSDSAALLKGALEELCLKFETEILISDSIMTPYKFIDVALLTYASSELIATAQSYSQGLPLKLEIGISGCTATVKVSGNLNISVDSKAKGFEKGNANLRLMLLHAAFASMGVNLFLSFKENRFELMSVIPLAEKSFETLRLSDVLANQFFVSRIIKQVFFIYEA